MTTLLLLAALAPQAALSQAHSHNDYEQPQPLELALSQGFASVEADIYLVEGALLVAHDRRDCDPNRTLDKLYLRPLWQRHQAGHHLPDILLIDVKSEAVETWKVLRRELEAYRPMLATATKPGIRVVISGSRARDQIFADDLTAYDGRPEDFDTPASWSLPLISMSWGTYFKWQGGSPFPASDKAKLHELVGKAHARGRKIRFWAAADTPEMWSVLYEAKVDLIGTDKPKELAQFLRSASASKK